uniref:Protein DA1-like domain-containing protein n=1 Tax=Haptolina brevifila TaxID=156173 RepID=A0A7S2D595_9EUKA|mmetsp:Transcript_33349/g.66370  ORF Transcript_33349/g.66370 Transcript_33349/m.66370 type:complete len:180 (+) Transcript_33349:456-995(+)
MSRGRALNTLAHEAGHVFLHLYGFDDCQRMPARVAEGLCELFAYLWEHSCNLTGEGDEAERRVRMKAMENCTDSTYGVGFRDALAAYASCGFSLPALLSRVKESGGHLPRAGDPRAVAWARQSGQGWQRHGSYHSKGEHAPRLDTWRRARVLDEERRFRSLRAANHPQGGAGGAPTASA